MSEELLTIEDVAIHGEDAKYSPYGYIIGEDGSIYTMTQQYVHGTILAILYPDLAKEKGFEPPTHDYNVYHYQDFELDHSDEMPIVRVSISVIHQMLNISKSDQPINPKQRIALTKVLSAQGVKLNERVMTDKGDMSASKALDWLSSHSREKENEEIAKIKLVNPNENKSIFD